MQVMKGKLPLPAKMQAGRMLQTLIAFSYKRKKNVFVNKYIVEYKTEQQSALPCYPG